VEAQRLAPRHTSRRCLAGGPSFSRGDLRSFQLPTRHPTSSTTPRRTASTRRPTHGPRPRWCIARDRAGGLRRAFGRPTAWRPESHASCRRRTQPAPASGPPPRTVEREHRRRQARLGLVDELLPERLRGRPPRPRNQRHRRRCPDAHSASEAWPRTTPSIRHRSAGLPRKRRGARPSRAACRPERCSARLLTRRPPPGRGAASTDRHRGQGRGPPTRSSPRQPRRKTTTAVQTVLVVRLHGGRYGHRSPDESGVRLSRARHLRHRLDPRRRVSRRRRTAPAPQRGDEDHPTRSPLHRPPGPPVRRGPPTSAPGSGGRARDPISPPGRRVRARRRRDRYRARHVTASERRAPATRPLGPTVCPGVGTPSPPSGHAPHPRAGPTPADPLPQQTSRPRCPGRSSPNPPRGHGSPNGRRAVRRAGS